MAIVRRMLTQAAMLCAGLCVATGCNTCLDPSAVPFRAASEVVEDVSTSGGDADGGVCEPDEDDSPCRSEGRDCGDITWVDSCGNARNSSCGRCGGGAAMCDEGVGQCVCMDGFDWDDGDCRDIDECAEGTADCGVGQNCTNLPGSFQCSTCPVGTFDVNGDGSVCTDIDECQDGTSGCDPLAGCTNESPGFSCGSCPSGYDDVNADGTSCVDIDECALALDNCSAGEPCVNAPGGFTCGCPRGSVQIGSACELFFVTEVTHHSVTVVDGTSETRQPIAAAATVDKLVPFASARVESTTSDFADHLVDVWIDTASRELVVQRDGMAGTVMAEVAVVEFSSPTVLMFPFSLTGSSTTLNDSAIGGATFAPFTYQANNVGDSRPDGLLSLAVSTGQISLERDQGGGALSGHVYAVIAGAGEFQAVHASLSYGENTMCRTTNLPFAPEDSLLLFSRSWSSSDGSLRTPGSSNVECHVAGTQVECCRERQASEDDNLRVRTTIVSWGANTPDGAVVHGTDMLASNVVSSVALPAAVDPARAMAWIGITGTAGAVSIGIVADADEGVAYTRARLGSANASIELDRGTASTETTTNSWEVVTWPLMAP